jgi:glycolate oxidase FAD binding subunit
MGDPLAQLEDDCGGHAAEADSSDAVDGVAAQWVARPADEAETAAVLRTCAEGGLAVVTRGAGTKLGWGLPPRRVDVVLDTTRMDRLVEHAAGDLVVVAGAGRRLGQVQADLAEAGQRLSIDPPQDGTIGGTIASAATGPIRLAHGAVRDLVIGATFVLADGTVAHSGGKVVKNVAGYDVAKLLTGSLGTLAVITQAAFRLHPEPHARAWVTAPVTGGDEAHRLTQAAVHSQTMPAALELDLATPREGTLCVQLEGVGPGVEQRAATMCGLLGPQAERFTEPPPWWGHETIKAGDVELRLTHELGALDTLLQALESGQDATGLAVRLRGSVGVGSVLAGVDASADPGAVAALVGELRGRAADFGGSVVVRDAPRAVKEAVDVWGPVSGLALMRSVKDRFDPGARLSPGRFVGGI